MRRGVLERIRPGVLVRPGALDELHPGERHQVMVRAARHLIRPRDVVSHESAGVLLGLPLVGPAPPKVHLSVLTTTHTRVTSWFVQHGVGARPPWTAESMDGLLVTTPARTAVDIAASRPLDHALPVVDHVLRAGSASRDSLTTELDRLVAARAKAGIAIGMGSGLSGSPAESVCRVRFRELGTPEPVQQHTFQRSGAGPAVVDFWFPAQGVVVEVDGRGKYEDAEMLDGRTTAEAHWREKRREDFIRSFPEVRAVVRLSWSDLMRPDSVRAELRRAGVPCR
ncbi:hypothetical protein EDF19_2298 [Curtobacterium sp. PhB115]|nr:hypothetical protein EDF19_2298 [Curtobacterium sp. PhB115]